jgi:hypothetical protein
MEVAMSRYSIKLSGLLSFVLMVSAALAQKTTGEIKGTIQDPENAFVPKASVSAKDTSTGLAFSTVSGGDGAYVVPNLLPGKYSMTVTAPGFQKSLIDDIVVETGRSTEVQVKLEVGAISQTVEVSGSAIALETTSNQVATTVRNDYIRDLPIAGRDVLQFSSLSAGFTPGPSTEPGTFNGLFQGALNVSLDGTNVNDNRYKSTNGYASLVALRLDAIEEVTVSTAGLQADAAAGGAMTLQFMTRRGTSQYHGSVFEEVRNDYFNATDFFTHLRGLPKPSQKLNDAGASLGGPLKIPFVPYFKNKLFFFLNYEDAPVPGASTKTATTLTPAAQAGNYAYLGTDGNMHTVNVLALAGTAGYTSKIDPIVQTELTTINGTLSKATLLPISNNYFQQTVNWKIPTGLRDEYPTARLDYQITDKVAYHVAWNLRHNHTDPTGPSYPGLPGASGESKETHYALSNGVDTTFTPSIFNSFKFGIQSTIIGLNIGNSIHQWASQGDTSITFGSGLSAFIPTAHPTIRGNPAYTFSDQLSWVKGKHNMKFGASGIYTRFYESDYYGNAGVLNYTLGVASSDPINSVFVAANFPFIPATTLSTPAALYATLTGRVSSISGTQNINEKTRQYEKFAPLVYRENYASWGAFFQDSFRVSPVLTLNYGFRWEVPGVMTNTNNTFMAPVVGDLLAPSAAPFEPGVFGPAGPNYVPAIAQRSVTYSISHVNPAPNFGFAWNPRADTGLMAKLLGGGRTVIRGSYGISYFDEGLNVDYWTNTNAGNWQLVTAAAGAQFAAGSLTLESPNPPFVTAPSAFTPPFSEYQFAFNNYDVATTKANMHEPYVQTWNLGIQRELSKTTLLEVRYVGNKTTHKWHQYTLQEVNIFENGFLPEFQNAQKNLAINEANGKGATFQNLGLAGEAPLPIFEHSFGPNGSFGALAPGSSWTSATFVNQLLQGQIGTTAATLQGRTASNEGYYCRLVGANFGPCRDLGYTGASSYPINFWAPNPYVGQNDWMADNSWGNYNGLQITLRQRLSHGATLTFNYAWSHALTDMPTQSTSSGNVENYTTIRDFRLDKAPLGNDRRQTYGVYGTYDLPFAPGRKWNFRNPVLSRVLGGWAVGAIVNVRSGAQAFVGSAYRTINNYGDGGVLLQGISASQFRGMLLESPRSLPAGVAAVTTADPSLIGVSGTANPAYLAPWQVAGTLGDRFYITGAWNWTLDTSLKKDIRVNDRLHFTLQGEFLNLLNHPEFDLPTITPTSTTFGQVTSSMVGPRNIQLRGYLRW